jgi:two-component system response regulator NreC
MPVLSGIEAVKKIREFDPEARALFLSMYDSEEYVYAVLVSGGAGLVNKNIDKQELFDAIIKICEGKNSFKGYTDEKLDEVKNRFVNYHTTIELNYDNLTEREKQVLFYIGRGYTSLEIAETLNLGKRTIDSFRTNIIEKLKLKSLPDLVRFAIQFSTLHKDFLNKI